ncbi:MAG: hypothetical protein M3135_09070 [Actinomycetota bacterium]|nr:hypothetical protein [Actinomycetota bacterium]
MQPFPDPARGPGRGPALAIALLAVGFLISSALAVVQYVQLQAAEDRIEELEAADGSQGDGGLFEGFEDVFGDIFDGGGGDIFGGEGSGALDLFECVGGLGLGGEGGGGTSVEAIAEEVERIRELRFEEVPRAEFLTGEETSERVRKLFLEEYTPEVADIEERMLTALGAIPRGTDLRHLRAEALGGQVAGYYEPETGELVVRGSGGEVGVADRITLAHELDHALTDQALGIPLPDDPELGSEDANLAALALVEGDATLVMQRYSTGLGLEEQLELLDPEAIAEAEAGLGGLPPYLQRELLFPYEQGLEFVCRLFADGGWAAVNRAYEQPPTTTAQILFPDRYPAGEAAVDPRDPRSPGKGWRELAHLQLGAANLLWLFEAPGGQQGQPAVEDPLAAAGAWGGGELVLWARGEDTAVGVALAERPAEDRLCTATSDWYASSFQGDIERRTQRGGFGSDGEAQDAIVACGEDEVRLGIAPDLETAERVAA